LISENKLQALIVVDARGRLRGLVTRANLLRLGHFVMRTQSPDEFSFFATRLRVRDVMVRNPATVDIGDTIEECLRRGRDLGVAQFPVLDNDKVVGIISSNEIFQLAAHFAGAWEKRNGVTLAPLNLGPGVLGKIADVAEAAGAVLQAIYPVQRQHDDEDDDEKSVILRFHAADAAVVVTALEAAGFAVAE
jgi:acetoin utilization protein AcuB